MPLKFLKTTKNKFLMQNLNPKEPEDLSIFQIIDANLDRAREGLRVLEDWSRFGLGENNFVIRKTLNGIKINTIYLATSFNGL